ncbi:hypothetical protein ACE1B6_16355 [Aerosakkonemataceae cyanobacterium BLCC-F154]|uniref:Uncharacterized protein n=1 Tax=Floridaenema fluviatile BLCC-F154 TaxID=3153640 RepID=A0ABV4YDJ1_9CYAN
MTFQTAKIQALIAEIDAVLSKDSKSRFSWLVGDGSSDRQMLQRVRQQLEQLARLQATGGKTEVAEIASYQVLFEQGDVEGDRSVSSESLQTEIDLLQQQRQELLNEIDRLQQQRKVLINPEILVEQQQIITEFSQELINRFQSTVNQQLAETLEKIQPVQLPEAAEETSSNQETESPELEFIGLETTIIDPELESIAASAEPFPYAGVELPSAIRGKLENKDSVRSQLEPNDTISALTDLIEGLAVNTELPEEDLLTTESTIPQAKVDFWLGDNIAEQLNEELSDLEIVEQPEPEPEFQPSEEVRETIGDVSEDLTDSIDLDLTAAVEQEKINSAIPEHILAEFEDLFGDTNNLASAETNPELELEKSPELVTKQEPVESEKKN